MHREDAVTLAKCALVHGFVDGVGSGSVLSVDGNVDGVGSGSVLSVDGNVDGGGSGGGVGSDFVGGDTV